MVVTDYRLIALVNATWSALSDYTHYSKNAINKDNRNFPHNLACV